MNRRQRKGQRRRPQAAQYFPLNDISGNQVYGERRFSPDRRLNDAIYDVAAITAWDAAVPMGKSERR